MGQYTTDMDNEIHRIEIEAYGAVLKGFIAQSEDLSWAKEGVITGLRKELRVSDAEHREILGKVQLDDTIKSIREQRNSVTDHQSKAMNPSLPYPSLVRREYNKRQKLTTPLPSLMYPCQPSSVVMPVPSSPKYITSTQPSSAPALVHVSSFKHLPQAQPSPMPVAIRLSSSKHLSHAQHKAVAMPSPLTVQSRDSQLNSETTNFEQHMRIISCSRVRQPGKKQAPNKGYVDSGSEIIKGSDIISIPDTDKLIDEVEKICGAQASDSQLMRVKIALEEHERALMEAIRKIAAVSDDGVQNENERCEESRQMDMEGFCYDPNYSSNLEKLRRRRKGGKSCVVFQDDAFPKICFEPIV